jgi:hypothetical protein
MRKSAVGVLLLLVAGCTGQQDLSKADEAVAKFHNNLNGQQYERIYATSDQGLKAAAPKADAVKLFSAVHQKLGDYQSGKRTGWRANYNTSGNNLVVEYQSKFDHGDATETFTFVGPDKALRLFGYNINSAALIP